MSRKETACRYWTTENQKYPVTDWKMEVANGDTRMGYWDWVEAKQECETDHEMES